MSLPVVFISNNQYTIPTYTALYSLLALNESSTYDIYIITPGDFYEENRKLLQSLPLSLNRTDRLSFITMGNEFAGNYVVRNIPVSTYYKLLIPWLLSGHNKIVYCDSDVIFLEGLSEVFSTNVEDYYIAGVHYKEYEDSYFKNHLTEIGVDRSHYINAGLLVMNCKKIRTIFSKEQIIKVSKTEYLYQDQDIINILFKNHICHLAGKFNCKANDILINNKKEFNMIHYAGLKPWNDFTACWIEWWDVFKKTPIFNVRELNKLYVKILDIQGWDQQEISISLSRPIMILKRIMSKLLRKA